MGRELQAAHTHTRSTAPLPRNVQAVAEAVQDAVQEAVHDAVQQAIEENVTFDVRANVYTLIAVTGVRRVVCTRAWPAPTCCCP
jgi:F0F1-type ATP synthase membrane subunit a